MPVYEYQCVECGKVQDKTFSMKDKPQEITTDTCEGCHKITTLKSILSPSAVQGFQYSQPGDR